MAPALFEPLALLPVGSLIALKSTTEGNRADSHLCPHLSEPPFMKPQELWLTLQGLELSEDPSLLFLSLSLSAYLQIGHTHKVQGS